MGQFISFKSEINNPWFNPWFILLHTHSNVCATVEGRCLEYLVCITLTAALKCNLFVHLVRITELTITHLFCTFDSKFRNQGKFPTLEKSQVLGTWFFSVLQPLLRKWKSRCWIKICIHFFSALQTYIFIGQESRNMSRFCILWTLQLFYMLWNT